MLVVGRETWMPTPASLNRTRLAAGLGLLTAKTVTVALIFEDVPPNTAGVLRFNPTRCSHGNCRGSRPAKPK